MNTQLEEDIRKYAEQQNQEPTTFRYFLEIEANKAHNAAIELIAEEYKLPRSYKDFQEEQQCYKRANEILIQQIHNGHYLANTPKEKFILQILLDIAEECAQIPQTAD